MPINNRSSINETSNNSFIATLDQIICVTVSITGIVGNVFVLIAFLSKWASLKTYEIFIVSLAFADLIGTLTYPSIELHRLGGGGFKLLGTNGCKILYFFPSCSIYVSSLTLVMVSIDRYIAVKWPFKQRHYLCRKKIIVTWIVGSGCAIYTILGVEMGRPTGHRWQCVLKATEIEHFKHAMFILLMQNVIPVFSMAILYSLIIYELHQNSARTFSCVSDDEIIRRRRHIKNTSSLLFVVVVVFFVCVTPHNVFYILYVHGDHNLPKELEEPVYGVLSMLMMANSCVNPLIYGKLHHPFRKQIAKIFRSSFHISKMSHRVSNWYQETLFVRKRHEHHQSKHYKNNNEHGHDFVIQDLHLVKNTRTNNENQYSLMHPSDTMVSELSKVHSVESNFKYDSVTAKRRLVRQSAIFEECGETVYSNFDHQSINEKIFSSYPLDDLETCIDNLDRETYI